jgi:hypothetical protein
VASLEIICGACRDACNHSHSGAECGDAPPSHFKFSAFEVAQHPSAVPSGADTDKGVWEPENYHRSAILNTIPAIRIGLSAGHVADENSLVLCRFFRKANIRNLANRT